MHEQKRMGAEREMPYKPDSVTAYCPPSMANVAAWRHFSRTTVTRSLKQPTLPDLASRQALTNSQEALREGYRGLHGLAPLGPALRELSPAPR